jgi:excisionase family DNA binding protein
MTSKLLTIREVANYFNITEKDVVDLAESGVIPAYKVGGLYLRFKKEQLEQARTKIKPNQALVSIEGTVFEKVVDYIYHHDFYLVSLAVIFFLLYFIVRL